MRLPLCLIALVLSATTVHAATFVVEGRRPAACKEFDEYAAFLDRKAAERVAKAGYERFYFLQSATGGGARYYILTVEALPRGYSASPGMRILDARTVLSSPRPCQ